MSRPVNGEIFKAMMLAQELDSHNFKVKSQLETIAMEMAKLEVFKEKIMEYWDGSDGSYKPLKMTWHDMVSLFEDNDEILKELRVK